MSGNPTGSNVVPMPKAPAAPQMPMPMPGMWGGGSLPWGPGCCPPGGMDALMKCYCDVQAATAFICSVMVQCVQNNPAVTAAIIAAIEASGSTLPTLGVTNGSNAQPGQVGEWVQFTNNFAYSGTTNIGATPLGVLQPGDWDCCLYANNTTFVSDINVLLDPVPAGFTSNLQGITSENSGLENVSVTSGMGRASITVPSLIVVAFAVNELGGTTSGTSIVNFVARRAR